MPEFRPRQTRLARQLRNHATDADRHLWHHLSRRQLGGFKFSRQMPVGPFFCDFMCREARLVIEVDGGQHDEREPLGRRRTAFIQAEGFRVIRFWNNEVIGNLGGVLLAILHALTTSHPRPLPQAGGEI